MIYIIRLKGKATQVFAIIKLMAEQRPNVTIGEMANERKLNSQ